MSGMSNTSSSKRSTQFETFNLSTPFGGASESNYYYDFGQFKQRARAYATTVVETIYRAEPQVLSLPLVRATEQERALLDQNAPQTYKSQCLDWISLTIVYFLVLITEAARGLIMPSAWPYFQSLGGSKSSLGAFIAAHSLGRLISTLPVGILADRYSMRTLICIACGIQAIGHFIYVGASSLNMLYFSRVLVGIGSASTFLSYTHIAKVVPPDQCLYYYAFASGILFIGVSVLPVIGGAMIYFPTIQIPVLPIVFNANTYGALILAIVNIAAVFIVFKYYLSPEVAASNYTNLSHVATTTPPISPVKSALKSYNSVSPTLPSVLNMRAIATCFIVNFILRGTVAMLETLSVPLLQEEFHLTVSAASKWMSAMGVLGVLAYFSIRLFPRTVSDRSLVKTGLFLVILGILPLSFASISKRLSLRLYVTFLSFAWSIGFPLAGTTIMSLFTKILKGGPVGSYLGMFSTTGGIAPLICGIPVSKLWSSFGTEAVFLTILGMTGSAFVLICINHRSLLTTVSI